MIIIMSHTPHHLTELWVNSPLNVYHTSSFYELNRLFLNDNNPPEAILIDLPLAMAAEGDLLKSVATLTHSLGTLIGVVHAQPISPDLQFDAFRYGADAMVQPPFSPKILAGQIAAFLRRNTTHSTHDTLNARHAEPPPQQPTTVAETADQYFLNTSTNPLSHPSVHLSAGKNGIAPQHKKKAPSLTRREKEVLKHLVQGKSNALIAESLSISRTTVKNHLAQVFRKLSVNNRTEAAYLVQQYGLL